MTGNSVGVLSWPFVWSSILRTREGRRKKSACYEVHHSSGKGLWWMFGGENLLAPSLAFAPFTCGMNVVHQAVLIYA